jgi:hypothetical protein
MMNSKRILWLVVGFAALIAIIGALTFLAFDRVVSDPDGRHESPPVIHFKLGPLLRDRYGIMPLPKRLPNLDAVFRDATLGRKIDVDVEYSEAFVLLCASVDVRQGSCWLYSSEGYVRFEPAGKVFARIDSSGPEKRYAFLNGTTPLIISLVDDSHGDKGYAHIKLRVDRGGGLDERYCRQPLAVCKETRSHVARFTFMLSEDFRGKIYDWALRIPK